MMRFPPMHGRQWMTRWTSLPVKGRGDVKRLQGSPYYRLRAGRYRVVFDQDQTTILAIYIGKRETTTYRDV